MLSGEGKISVDVCDLNGLCGVGSSTQSVTVDRPPAYDLAAMSSLLDQSRESRPNTESMLERGIDSLVYTADRPHQRFSRLGPYSAKPK